MIRSRQMCPRAFRQFIRLSCEQLEHRTTPALFTVTNLADNGAGTLRAALSVANGNGTADTIDFQAGISGVMTLTSSSLFISEAVTIIGPGSGGRQHQWQQRVSSIRLSGRSRPMLPYSCLASR